MAVQENATANELITEQTGPHVGQSLRGYSATFRHDFVIKSCVIAFAALMRNVATYKEGEEMKYICM